MKFFEWIQRYSCFVEKNESPKLVYIRGNNGINKQDTFLKESSWRKSLMGAELSLRSKSFLRWQWPSFGLTAPTIMVDFYAFARSTLVHAGEWRRWETRTQKVGYRFSGSRVHLTVVLFLITVSYILIGLLFFFYFFLPFFLSSFLFFCWNKSGDVSLPIVTVVRTNFWPKQGSFLASVLHESATFFHDQS